ncbi:MAG: hypothetical protein KFB97_04705 [Cyanobium sp. M30B3]|nr:MAG: hypothetical protein KFB97_04705 [Cyanobium sp. M30B3]
MTVQGPADLAAWLASQQSVMAAIEGLSRELTIVLSAHRLSTVDRCWPRPEQPRYPELTAGLGR